MLEHFFVSLLLLVIEKEDWFSLIWWRRSYTTNKHVTLDSKSSALDKHGVRLCIHILSEMKYDYAYILSDHKRTRMRIPCLRFLRVWCLLLPWQICMFTVFTWLLHRTMV